ncbi:MAG: hypothetical protein ACW99A_05105 [Candidatus Kariarchaeaceae archaeon]
MSPATTETTSNSFAKRVKNKWVRNEEHIKEGSSFFFAIGILFAIVPLIFFVLFYYMLFYIDIFTR